MIQARRAELVRFDERVGRTLDVPGEAQPAQDAARERLPVGVRVERLSVPAASPPAEAQEAVRWEQDAKPPHETSRAELEESFAKRRVIQSPTPPPNMNAQKSHD